jgi:hypothetical protein
MNYFSCSNQTNINQENTKNYPFTVKNTCEFIKNDNILENKIYSTFFAIENIPICQQKWEIYFGVELPWEEICGRHFKNLANRKSKHLQWKVIHTIIYTEERLQVKFNLFHKMENIVIPWIIRSYKWNYIILI